MSEDNLRLELRRLAARLDRLERLLHVEPAEGPETFTRTASSVESMSADAAQAHTIAAGQAPSADLAPPVEPPPMVAPSSGSQPSTEDIDDFDLATIKPLPTFAAPAAQASVEPAAPPITPAYPAPPIVRPHHPAEIPFSASKRVPRHLTEEDGFAHEQPSTASRSLEQLIGGKWMAWVGTIIVLLAVAFAVLIGIDRGLWGRLSPLTRCLFIAGFGAAMIAVGEVALRRIGKAAAAGLISAGLGTLYLDAFATFRFFHLVDIDVAFVLMALVAVGGFAITLHTRFLTIGVLSIIGGYLTPLLLRGQSTHDLELLAYLTMLLAMGLGLSAVMPRDFRALRYVALGGQMFVGLGWLVANASSQWKMAIVFMSMWWTMVLAEAIFAALRRQSAIGNAVVTLIATGAYVTAGCWVLALATPTSAELLGVFTGGIGLLGAAAALHFGPGLDALRGAPRTAIDKLAVALWAQSGVLAAVAIALQFKGFGQSIGWLALALAAIETGRRLPSRAVAVFGLIVGALAVTRVALLDWWIVSGMNDPLATIGDLRISPWAILAAGTVLAMHVAAHRLRAQPPANWRVMPAALALLGTLLWFAICVVQGQDLVVTGGWLLASAVLLGLHRMGLRTAYFEIAIGGLALTAARWLMLDTLASRLEPGWSARAMTPVLNWQMAMAAAIAFVGWWSYRIALSRPREGEAGDGAWRLRAAFPWQIVLLGGIVFGLIALSFEVDRAVSLAAQPAAAWSVGHVRQVLLTLLWSLGATGVGLLALSMRWRRLASDQSPPMMLVRFAWSILIACALKWALIDALWPMLFDARVARSALLPLMNVQMLTAGALAAGLLVLWRAARRETVQLSPPWSGWIPVLASVLVLWAFTFEIDRMIVRADALPQWLAAWRPMQLRSLWWTALWAVGGLGMLIIGRWRGMLTMTGAGWCTIVLAAAVWLTFDTLSFRLMHGAVGVAAILNLQFAVGGLLAALLWFTTTIMLRARGEDEAAADNQWMRTNERVLMPVAFGLIAALGLWMGSLEIDRVFDAEPMVRQTGLSVYWGLFGAMLVVVGFIKRVAASRYAGLGLLSVTALKVLFIDFAGLDGLPKVISFAVAGLLLIGTSVVYARLSPKLLASNGERD